MPLNLNRVADRQALLDHLPAFTHDAIKWPPLHQEYHGDRYRLTLRPPQDPRLYQVETTSRCNLRCPFCPRTTDLLPNRQRSLIEVLPIQVFKDLLDQMPWLRSVELFHFGEPFLTPDFDRYVSACTYRGVYSVVATNALEATPERVDRTFEAGLNFLVVDLDSLDSVRYAHMRAGGDLDQLKERLLYILDHPHRPYTVVQTINLDGKPEFTPEAFAAFIEGHRRPNELRYKFLDSFRGEADEAGELGAHICREPFYGFTVHANGDVVPCDRDWAGENVMGNIKEQSIKSIWYGAKFVAFRRAMLSDKKPAMCVPCKEGRMFNARSQPHIQVNMFRGRRTDELEDTP